LYWASKGFLSIDQLSEDEFALVKIKDLPSDSMDMRKICRAAFQFRGQGYDRRAEREVLYDCRKHKGNDKGMYNVKGRELYSASTKALGWL
jgi:hypothetical protein